MGWTQLRIDRRVAMVLALALLIAAAATAQGHLRALGRFDGDLAWQRPHADAVADWALNSAGARYSSGAGDLFDHEWTLVSCQMAVLGLGQLTLEHPELGDTYLPAMASCSDWLVSEGARRFGTAKWGEDFLSDEAPAGSHAYMGYIALALSMHRRVQADPSWAPVHDRMLDRLEVVLQRPIHQIETYPGEVYPADIASAIGAVGLAGRPVHSVAARFRAAAVDPDSGLLYQALRATTGGAADDPRGSGTAIASYFLGHADPGLSADLCRSLKVDRVVGISGVREYREGAHGWGDVDSGPVVFGLGVSATGFALGCSRMHGDRGRFVRMHRTAGIFGVPTSTRRGRWYWTGGSIGNSILLAMMTAPPVQGAGAE